MEGEEYDKFIAESENSLITDLDQFYLDKVDRGNKWLFTYFVLALKMNRTVAATLLSTMCTPHNLMFQVRQWAFQSPSYFYYDDFESILGFPSEVDLERFCRDLWNSIYAGRHGIRYEATLWKSWTIRLGEPSQSNAVFYLEENKAEAWQTFRAGILFDEKAAHTAKEPVPCYEFEINNKEVSKSEFFKQLKAVFI